MKSFFFALLHLLCFATAFCQTDNSVDLDEKYSQYFKLDKENIYTHLNKSNVLVNEELWFQSYIFYNKNNTPFISTTMVYYNVYDEVGDLIDQKVFHAEDGFVNGQIEIDDKYSAGVYYLKTTTNWMRNFNIDNSDFKTFVVNSETQNVEDFTTTELQIIPEGGNLIANTVNTIGVKINGNLSDYKSLKGIVEKANGEVSSFFSVNRFGLSKFNIHLNEKEDYTIKVYNGENEILSKKINNIQSEGLNISVKNGNDKFIATLRTNNKTLKKLAKKTYRLHYHRDGVINHIDINFEKGTLQYSIEFLKSELLSGINIITLFDDKNHPVLERILFNEQNINLHEINLINIETQKDSTILHLKPRMKKGINHRFSVSVLPEYTKSDNFSDNIVTKMLLSPYLNSPINSYSNYLNSINNESLYNLDLLLLSEGKSKQSWKDIIYKPQRVKYPFDTGFQIKGKLNTANTKKASIIELISPINAIAIRSDLLADNFFEFSNLYLNKDTSISFVLRDKNEKAVRAYPYYNLYPKPIIDSINTKSNYFKTTKPAINTLDGLENFIMDDETIELEEVDLKTIEKRKKPINNPAMLNASNLVEIPDKENNTQLVLDFIRTKGFDVVFTSQTVYIRSRRVTSLSGGLSPQVFLDHADINTSLQLISTMRLNEVEEIFISKNGAGFGSNGAGGVISIFSRKGFSSRKKSKFKTFDIGFGFDSEEDFKTPFYHSSTTDNFDYYGVIDWKSSVKVDDDGIIRIKIPNAYNHKVNLYINGMDENGNLYRLAKKVSLK